MYIIIFMITIFLKAAAPSTINQIDTDVDGVLIKRTYINSIKTTDMKFTCPPNALGYICADDCHTLLACHSTNREPLFITNCADNSPSTPYCLTGTSGCTNMADYNNTQCIAAQLPTFPCTSIGCFPDPSDCTMYHKCTKETQETYKCPEHYIFDANKARCKLKNDCKDCFTIDCTSFFNQLVPYPGHKSYYANCSEDGTKMYKCGDINHFQFNRKTLDCEFICKSSGWFPNYKNCQQYYECVRIKTCRSRGRKWFKKRLHTCPKHYIFDAVRQHCVKGECVTKPKPPSITECPTEPTTSTTSTPLPPLHVRNID